MRHIFIVHGYGIPKNITQDEHYRHYLGTAFNEIFETAVRKNVEPVVIFCGGKTDVVRPHTRTEAGEMKKYFLSLAKRSFVRQLTKIWKYEREDSSISTLENILFAKKIIDKKFADTPHVTFIFERTRQKRIAVLAKKIFTRSRKLAFVPVDFDVSMNRYDLRLIDEKERAALRGDIWSLKSAENLKEHHSLFGQKLNIFRQAGPKGHEEAIRKWWQLAKDLSERKS